MRSRNSCGALGLDPIPLLTHRSLPICCVEKRDGRSGADQSRRISRHDKGPFKRLFEAAGLVGRSAFYRSAKRSCHRSAGLNTLPVGLLSLTVSPCQ
ncbi:hypothetical protein MHYP_G00314040 [Metynnis hypsauchen]